MNLPLVSVAVPIYGVEKYIEKCAISLFEQTYQNLEFIFVNDCTKDKSIEILKSIIEQYPNRKSFVKIINHQNNQGLGKTRNTAIQNCSGEFVISVDSDDWLELDAIESLVNKQKENNSDIVYGNIIINEKTRHKNFLIPNISNKRDLLLHVISHGSHHEVCSRLIRRSLYTDHNIKVEKGCNIAEDWQVSARLLYYANKIDFIDKDIYHYLIDNTSSYMHSEKTHEKIANVYRNEIASLSVINNFFKDKESTYKDAISKFIIKQIYKDMIYASKSNDLALFRDLNSFLSDCDINDLIEYIGKGNKLLLIIKRIFFAQRIVYIFNYICRH